MKHKIFFLVSLFLLSAMLVLNLGYVQAQTPGQIPMFDQPATGFCNSAGGNDCIDSVITQDASGNIGIGTASPGGKLDVVADTVSSGGNTANFAAPNIGPNASHIHFGTTGDWYIRSASNSGKVILQDTGGNVGIGTANPGAKLHVVDSTPAGTTGVRGQSFNGFGVLGTSTVSIGVEGFSNNHIGVLGGTDNPNQPGVIALSHGSSATNLGLRVEGRGEFTGFVTKAAGGFKIDHPLDPANKYLYHSFVESPDMMNVYNGNTILDNNGEAWVELPKYFETLNKDFRYLLTSIGAPGPNLYIAEEISGNRFKIAGGKSGGKVSWQVTGIRQDPFAEKYRIPVEEEKPAAERGYYMHPDLYGQPQSQSLAWARDPEGMKRMVEEKERINETDARTAALP